MHIPVRVLLFVVLVALAAAPAPGAHAEDGEVIASLLEKVEYWKSRGREDKVAEVWRKVLDSDPNHGQALAELCVYEAQSGHKKQAREYLRRLETAQPGHPDLPRLRRIVDMSEDYRVLIEEARALNSAGRTQEALAKYRLAFGEEPPPGYLAVEYYTTLGGTKDGWEEARIGLERLHAENPDDADYKLVYAKHLTYREKTRRDGIALLRGLASNSQLRNQARPAWKDALLWLHARASDQRLFKQYLDEVGEDAEVRERMKTMATASAPPPPKSAGEQALDRNDFQAAERYYSPLLADKKKRIEGLIGMAKIAMARGQFDQAREYLEEVKRLDPRKRYKWEELFVSVEFWSMMSEAETLRVQGRLAEAEAKLRQAIALSRREAHHAEAALGNIFIAQGEWERALDRFEAVLKKHPNHVAALRGMIRVLIEVGREGEAAQLNARLAKLEAKTEPEQNRRNAESLRWLAAIERSAGRHADALQLLDEARQIDPADAWVLHDLVHVHLALGNVEEARWVVEELMGLEPDMLEVQLARACVLAEEDRLTEALDVALAIPTDGTHMGLDDFVRELQVRVELERLLELGRRGPVGEAYRGLERLETEVLDSPALLSMVALAWSELGDYRRAQGVMNRALARTAQPTTTMRLQLGAILLRAERFEDLGTLLEELERADTFSTREHEDYTELRIAYGVRRADLAAANDRHDRAYEYLYPLLEEFPDEPRVLASLGRLFLESGDHESAHAIFVRLLEMDPTSDEAMEGSIRAAIGAGHRDQARELVEAGLAAYPNDARMHLIAARSYLMMGNDFRAMDLLRHGLELAEQEEAQADATPEFEGEGEESLSAEASHEEILLAAARAFGRQRTETTPLRGSSTLREEIEAEMLEVRARNSERVGAGLNLRYRHGVAGLGQLVEFSVPITAGLAMGTAGVLSLTAEAVAVDAGDLDVANPDVGDLFGQVGRVNADTDNEPWSQSHRGISLGLAYAYRGWWVHVGSTPLGFPLQTFVGGLGWSQKFGDFSVSVRGGRQLVRDSLVSMGCGFDPVIAEPWGLVTANGGRFDVSYEHGPMLYYGFGGFDWLHGTQVVTNRMGQGGAGLRWGFHERSAWRFKTGISLGVMGYSANQRYYTWGHGGYFSPQIFFNGSIPLVIEGDTDRIYARMEADIGINYFREDEVPYYPLDSWMQEDRAVKVDSEGEPAAVMYEEQGSIGLAINFRGRLGYRVSPQLMIGAEARAHYAHDYQEYFGGIFLGYSFRPGSRAGVPVPQFR
jgi:cellulose synthase operon protein C